MMLGAPDKWLKDETAFFRLNCITDTTVTGPRTAILDPNFEEALIELGYDIGPVDGSVSTDEIKDIKVLRLGKNGIVSLSGINEFESLEFLQMLENPIQEIDLTQNKNLKRLALIGGDLAVLDVSNSTELTSLYVRGMPRLTDIDISQNTKLEALELPQTGLKRIDLSNNVKINYLDVDETKLEALDLSSLIDLNGCALLQTADLAAKYIRLAIGSNPCANTPSGRVRISMLEDIDLHVTIVEVGGRTTFDGTATKNNPMIIDNLEGGFYTICVDIPSFPLFNQCYEVGYFDQENTILTNVIIQKTDFFPLWFRVVPATMLKLMARYYIMNSILSKNVNWIFL